MELLKDRIRRDGVNLGKGILKVDSFINHQVDPALMLAVGGALAARFAHLGANKIVTAEISGIAPALTTALALGIPVVYARKTKPVTMHPNAMTASAPSHTKGVMTELMISPEFLGPRDHVLVIDDFLARGETIRALVRLVQNSGAALVGIGAVIEKRFEGGREALADLNVPIETLAVITAMDNGKITLEE
jgi:xanthine phosphoribosyltransferase